MKDIDIYEFVTEIKNAFGSCKILDDLDPIEDIPNIYKFAKIVNNYNAMSKLLAETPN